MELTAIFNYCVDLSGQFLLKDTALELTKDIFLSSLKSTIRTYNKFRPYSKHEGITLTDSGKYTFTDSLLKPIPMNVSSAILTSGLSGFFPLSYFQDSFNYEMNKQAMPVDYRKPSLYMPTGGVFDVETVNYYRIREQLAISDLVDTYVGHEVTINLNDTADSICSKLVTVLDSVSGLTAYASAATAIDVRSDNNGVTQTPATAGNTGWPNLTIVQIGDATHPQILLVDCEADTSYSLLSKYILVATPAVTHYFWFNIDNYAGDPISNWYFVDYIEDDNDNDLFFKLCLAKFKKQLGGSRRAFTLEEFPITNDADSLISDAQQEEQEAMEELIEGSAADLAW